MDLRKLQRQLHRWRLKNIGQRQFIYLLSLIIGVITGLAAVMLKNLVYYTHYLITNGFKFAQENFLYLAIPLAGLFLTVLFVKYFVRDNIGHGVSRILYAISRKNGIIKRHNTYTSMIGSTLTVAFGGSVGLEAPIVLTGSAIGSNVGRLFHLNYRSLILLIGCGAAGAIAGIFKSPIAAVVFAIEVLMLELTLVTLIPLLISAVTGATVAFFLMGKSVVFSYSVVEPFVLRDIPWYLLLGIFTGIASYYFTKTTMKIEGAFSRIKNTWNRLLIGGIILSILIFIFPSLYGEGYEALKEILNGNADILINEGLFGDMKNLGWFLLLIMLMILAFKVVAMAVTNGAGGVGGIFAPTLFMGGIAGFFVARILNMTGLLELTESHFALVGMGGMMAGVMHAPLTAIFLIAEITGGYELLTPLIITATISYLTIMYFEPHSVYTKRLAQRGELFTHDKDQVVMSIMKVDRLIETNFKTIHPEATLGELVEVIARSERNVFPVVDNENNFLGVVFINDIRHIMFKQEMYDNTYIDDLMFMPSASIHPNESMDQVAKKFQESGNFNLPVIENGKYRGFVSRAKVFSNYRKMLKNFTHV